MTPLALKLGATVLTLVSLAGSTTFVVRHVKNAEAPLHPSGVKVAGEAGPALQPRTRLDLEPSVRTTDQQAPLTFTYVS